MDQRDHRRLSAARQSGETLPPPRCEELPLDDWLQRGEDEEDPEQAQEVH
jgi:hypothetical protein